MNDKELSELATKDDLRKLEERMDRRFLALEQEMKRLHEEVTRQFEEAIRHFDVVAENIQQDLAGANADEISLIKQKQTNLAERVESLEYKVGV